MSIEEKESFEKFLTDVEDAEDGVGYIQPDIELKLPKEKREECRQIIQEIKNFGIRGQRQYLYLIYLLSLELEDPETSKKLIEICKSARKDLKDEKQLIF